MLKRYTYPAKKRWREFSRECHLRSLGHSSVVLLTTGLYGQANKRIRWMPWQLEAMKDVGACEKLRGVGNQTVIRRCPNGGTHLPKVGIVH